MTVRPVRLDFTVISSAYCGSWASAYVMATQLMLGRIIGWSTQFSIFSPNIYTRVFSSRRLSIYSFALFIAIFLPPKFNRVVSDSFWRDAVCPEHLCPRHWTRRNA